MEKVLIVGQTPPPFGGQALMIEKLLDINFENVEIYHVRLAFSQDMSEVGRFQFKKLFHLMYVIGSIFYMRIRHGIHILYYPPAGPHKIPMFRDIAILATTRWLFEKIVFHFHAGGISELYPQLPPLLKYIYRKAYWNPDAAILLSERNPADGERLQARKQWVIPYGIEDHSAHFNNNDSAPELEQVQLLYVGILRESKGLLILIEACRILHEQGFVFELNLVGEFASEIFKQTALHNVASYQLENHVRFMGVLTGDDKWRQFSKADIFCFPSFFESETFGLVVLEAMQFGLPVVATWWRGIPSLVRDGETGYLVPIKDPEALAEKIKILLQNPKQAREMGRKGREVYLENYTIDKYKANIEEVFLSVTDQ